jgi:glycosyltransferase involved in cell wall biosynthesis
MIAYDTNIKYPPGVSIIICSFNSADRIGLTLEHLQQQVNCEHIGWEVILVDNASTDKTKDIAAASWNKKPLTDFRILFEPQQGKAFALKKGVNDSKYDYICIIDDDNRVDPQWIHTVYETMQNHPECAAAGGMNRAVFEKEEPAWFRRFEKVFATGRQEILDGYVPSRNSYLWGAGMTFRHSVWDELYRRGYPEIQSGRVGKSMSGAGEDSELCFAFQLCGYRLWYTDKLKLDHYMPAARMTTKNLFRLMRGLGRDDVTLTIYRNLLIPGHAVKKSWQNEAISFLGFYIKFLIKYFSFVPGRWLDFRALNARHTAYLFRVLKLRSKYNSISEKINAFGKSVLSTNINKYAQKINVTKGITLVVFSKNNERSIESCINSIAAQQKSGDVPVEIKFIIPESSEPPEAALLSTIPDDFVVNVHTVTDDLFEGMRLSVSLASSHDIIAFIDDETVLEKDWLLKSYKFMSENPDCGICGSANDHFFVVEPFKWTYKYIFNFQVGMPRTTELRHIDKTPVVWKNGSVIRKKLLDEAVTGSYIIERNQRNVISPSLDHHDEFCWLATHMNKTVVTNPEMKTIQVVSSAKVSWYYIQMIYIQAGRRSIASEFFRYNFHGKSGWMKMNVVQMKLLFTTAFHCLYYFIAYLFKSKTRVDNQLFLLLLFYNGRFKEIIQTRTK